MPIKIYKTNTRGIQQLHKAIQQDFLMLWNQTQKENTKTKHKTQTGLPFDILKPSSLSLPKLSQLFLTPWPASLLISIAAATKTDGGSSPHHL